ncbi:MAG: hypothetical protein K9J06_16165 [Flavobacteriales bacterium]|nr:hypothetical protein [Flavobacteriales bacterium]
MEKAIAQLQALPEKDQDALAQSLLDELKWEYALSSDNTSKLSNLADEALEEYHAGKTLRP